MYCSLLPSPSLWPVLALGTTSSILRNAASRCRSSCLLGRVLLLPGRKGLYLSNLIMSVMGEIVQNRNGRADTCKTQGRPCLRLQVISRCTLVLKRYFPEHNCMYSRCRPACASVAAKVPGSFHPCPPDVAVVRSCFLAGFREPPHAGWPFPPYPPQLWR